MYRLMASFFRFLRRCTRRAEPRRATGFACTAQAKAPLVFKGGASVTMASPYGAYAGKSVPDPRRLAEQQFHRMNSSYGATIN